MVTEAISVGEGIRPIATALKELGIVYDFASVSFLGERGGHPYFTAEEVGDKLGGEIHYGMENTPGIYGNRISGLVKKIPLKPSDIFSSRGLMSGDEFKTTRTDAKNVADNLIDWYESR